MKLVVQRVAQAKVEADQSVCGEIGKGLLLYVCLEVGDTRQSLEEAAEKVVKMRIFEDDRGKMNLNVGQAGGEILSVSQFTLSWSGERGNRPSFDRSMAPAPAKLLYHMFNQMLQEAGLKIEAGRFGSDMRVTSVNDGPVTFHLSF